MGRLNPNFTHFAQPVKSLSGGQRQAVAIARAVYFNARILIMDEPTAALGPAETAQVRNLVRQLKDEGIGIFLISHDIHDVFDLSDRISVMYHGRIVDTVDKADVTPDDVLGMIILGKKPGEVTEKEQAALELRALRPARAAHRPRGRRAPSGERRWNDRGERRVELAVRRRAARRTGRVRARASATGVVRRRSAAGGRLDRREPARPDGRQQRGAVRRALGRARRSRSRRSSTSARIWRHSGLAVPPPDARIWVGRRHPGRRPSGRARRAGRRRRPRAPPASGAAGRGRAVRPTNAPRASGSGCGLRSPVR